MFQISNTSGLTISEYVYLQLKSHFPGTELREKNEIERALPKVLDRVRECFKAVKMWSNNSLNVLHSSQYTIFLYFLSNELWKSGAKVSICEKIFYLNKSLNSIDLFFEIELPEHFFIGHSTGIVLSKAKYADYFAIYQNCTVGKSLGDAPSFEDGVLMYPGSMVIGKCFVGSGSVISPGVKVVNRSTPANSYVFQGQNGDLIFKAHNQVDLNQIFNY
jgi:serine O-acetyltransferase